MSIQTLSPTLSPKEMIDNIKAKADNITNESIGVLLGVSHTSISGWKNEGRGMLDRNYQMLDELNDIVEDISKYKDPKNTKFLLLKVAKLDGIDYLEVLKDEVKHLQGKTNKPPAYIKIVTDEHIGFMADMFNDMYLNYLNDTIMKTDNIDKELTQEVIEELVADIKAKRPEAIKIRDRIIKAISNDTSYPIPDNVIKFVAA